MSQHLTENRRFFTMRQTILTLGMASVLSIGWAYPSASTPSTTLSNAADPESLLIEIYNDLEANRINDSLYKSKLLVDTFPNFRLGQLIRGDILLMQATPLTAIGNINNVSDQKLEDLRREALVRLQFLKEPINPKLIPQPVLQVSDEYNNVIVTDVSRSRLYLYKNIQGKLQFETSFYVSQGRLGAYKTKQGDQRTPIGIYDINGFIPGTQLPDFYGPGALPISYPNDWDTFKGRNGNGIWFHGTPPNTYNRAPLASDGCIVLSNNDFSVLKSMTETGKTIVVIGDQIKFITPDAWNKEKTDFEPLLKQWQNDLANPAKLATLYSPDFRSNRGYGRTSWLNQQYKKIVWNDVKLSNVNVLQYPGKEGMLVTSFTMESANNTLKKRLYWKKEGSEWRIIFEGSAS